MLRDKLPHLKKALFRIVSAAIRDRLFQVASSLAFTTILAIVPLLAVTLSLMTAFPIFADFESALQTFLREQLMPDAFSETVMRYLDEFVAQASRLSTVGGLFLMVTAILVILSIDDALNDIWHVKQQRSIGQRLLIYWAVLSVGPIILGASIWTSSLVAHQAFTLGGGAALPLALLASGAPFFLGGVACSLLFAIVPNCRVPFWVALVGGFTTASLFEMIKWGLGLYFAQIPTYTVIYGAFSVLPAFLLWIYLSWFAVLIGAIVSANLLAHDHTDRHDVRLHHDNTNSPSYNDSQHPASGEPSHVESQ